MNKLQLATVNKFAVLQKVSEDKLTLFDDDKGFKRELRNQNILLSDKGEFIKTKTVAKRG